MDVSPSAIKAPLTAISRRRVPQSTGWLALLLTLCRRASCAPLSVCSQVIWLLLVAGLCCLALAVPLSAQQEPKSPAGQRPSAPGGQPEKQEGFYDVDQLERLFRIAKESGFGDEELRQITIEDEHGKTVNAWDYLQKMKGRRDVKDRGTQDRLQKIYLTVQDVLAELRRREKEDLRDLRDKSVFKE